MNRTVYDTDGRGRADGNGRLGPGVLVFGLGRVVFVGARDGHTQGPGSASDDTVISGGNGYGTPAGCRNDRTAAHIGFGHTGDQIHSAGTGKPYTAVVLGTGDTSAGGDPHDHLTRIGLDSQTVRNGQNRIDYKGSGRTFNVVDCDRDRAGP